ncbi:hypothetical protein Barb7_00782 [Bacteroidales bacterium Barb7]|nr:hypothetical protein Barb7_00782 [Bacteroidales bacterium Barb7]
MSAFISKGCVCTPPFEATVFDSDSCCAKSVFTRNFPNCISALTPKRAAPPLTNELEVVILTFPASIFLIISSSSP